MRNERKFHLVNSPMKIAYRIFLPPDTALPPDKLACSSCFNTNDKFLQPVVKVVRTSISIGFYFQQSRNISMDIQMYIRKKKYPIAIHQEK